VKSQRAFAGALLAILALPLAILSQFVLGGGGEAVIHWALGAGVALVAISVFDFVSPRWIAWVAALSAGCLAILLLLQGTAVFTGNDFLLRFAYQVLGQRLETMLVDLILVWCIALLWTDSTGKTRVVGIAAMSLVVCLEIYKLHLAYHGSPFNAQHQLLKLLYLSPFAWLLLESRKRTARSAQPIN
jgi:hypothetical protein